MRENQEWNKFLQFHQPFILYTLLLCDKPSVKFHLNENKDLNDGGL